MSTSSTPNAMECPYCGAKQAYAGTPCWLCGNKNPMMSDSPRATGPLPSDPAKLSFSLSTLLLIVTLASVTFGILAVNPGLGVFACVILAPVIVRTVMVVRRREQRGVEVRPVEKIGLFLASFGVATILAVVVSTAAFASFCGVCLMMVSMDRQYGGSQAVFVGILVCALALGLVLMSVRILKWIRERYRRDIGEF